MARRLPSDIDAVDLMFAVSSICDHEPLRAMGLNRRGYSRARKAQRWFWGEFVKAVRARHRSVISRRKRTKRQR